MREHRFEVADVFRAYEKEFFAQWGHVLGADQRNAFAANRDCRTAALGGHVEYVEQCDAFGHRAISYNSCRNRHCPKCQAMARAEWLAEKAAKTWCEHASTELKHGGKPWSYLLIPHDAITGNMTLAGLASRFS